MQTNLTEGSIRIAAAYLRVSDERQDEYSLDSQLKLIREYAAKNNYIVPDEFVFVDDGISGRNAKKRTSFQNMIGWAKEKDRPFEAILTWKFSRFARNQEESIVYKSMLKKIGVSVISISEPLPEGPFGSLIERILEWMDEFYSVRLSAEVKRGMTEKASRGEAMCHPAFGYDLKNKRYFPNGDADIVREIFNSYLSGTGMRAIATKLSERGIRTYRGGKPDNRWIDYILHNPVYIGKIRWSTDGRAASTRHYDDPNIMITEGLHEAIIDEDTWERTQKKLLSDKAGYRKYQRREQPVEWMLKGLVRCSSCGSTLVYQSLACPSMQCHSYARGTCRTSHSLSIAKANKAVISALEDAVGNMSFNIIPHTPSAPAPKTDYQKLIALEQAKLRRIYEAYEAGIDSLEEYAKKKDKINSAIAQLSNQAAAAIEDSANNIDKAAFSKKVSGVIDFLKSPDATEEAKNKALRSIISHIVYEKERQNLAIYFYT